MTSLFQNKDLLNSFESGGTFESWLIPFQGIFAGITLASIIPSTLTCIGIWSFYVSCKNPDNKKVKGLSIIKGVSIYKLLLLVTLFAVGIYLFISNIINIIALVSILLLLSLFFILLIMFQAKVIICYSSQYGKNRLRSAGLQI